MANVTGTTGSDLIDQNYNGDPEGDHVSDADDTVHADPGDDRVFGLGGSDVLDGGADNDTLIGGSGDDDLFGGSGDDTASYANRLGLSRSPSLLVSASFPMPRATR